MSGRRVKRALGFLLSLCILAGAAGCIRAIESPSSTENADAGITIAIYSDSSEGEYWRQILIGIEAAGSALLEQARVVYVEKPEDARDIGADVLIMYAEQQTLPSVGQIPVVYVEATQEGALCVGTDYGAAGDAAAAALAQDLTNRGIQKGKLVVIASKLSTEAALACRSFVYTAKAAGLFTVGEELLLCPEGADMAALVGGVGEDAVAGIFAADTASAEMLARYIQENGLEDALCIISLGANETIYKEMRMGAIYGVLLKDPVKIGKTALDLAARLAEDGNAAYADYPSGGAKIDCVLIDRSNIDDPSMRVMEDPFLLCKQGQQE